MKIVYAFAVLIIAAVIVMGVVYVLSAPTPTTIGEELIYLKIGNLSENLSDCGVSEKQVFYDLLWKESQLKSIPTDSLWSNSSSLGELYLETQTVYADHLDRCSCIVDVTAFQTQITVTKCNINETNCWEENQTAYNRTLRSGIPSCVFKYLPAEPYNFQQVSEPLKQFWDAQLACTLLGPEYWKQPEFYKTQDTWLNYYKEVPFGLTGKGYGGYSDEAIAGVTPGLNFSMCLFIYTGAGVSSYQAIPLDVYVLGGEGTSPTFGQNQFSDGNRTVGTEDMSKYFEIEIVPKTILLEPAYPLFFGNWTQKVVLNIRVSPDTPKGRYMVILGPFGTVPEKQDREWRIEYGNRYMNQAGFYQEVLKLGIEVA